ncbi:MAG: phosphate ABC transporter ATP-binding protein [Acidobacteriota bacterium]
MKPQTAKSATILELREHQSRPALEVRHLSVWFHEMPILKDIHVSFPSHRITCIIGPSGGGKSTLIRSLNRMNDEVNGFSASGSIHFRGRPIDEAFSDVASLRREVGMVFQKPCVFPRSIRENVLFGIWHARRLSNEARGRIVEENLKAVSLWKEVSHRLDDKADGLSIGQQQRLCIARTLAVRPRVILLDEPTSSLDPVSTKAVESLMLDLKDQYTLVFVTHNIQQARRIADHLVFICAGQVIEQGPKKRLFSHPVKEQTRNYLNEEYCEC